MLSINLYVNAFEDPAYQLALGRLYLDLGTQDPEEWAQDLYLVLRDDPLDPRARSLNQDRKTSLSLLYQIVDAWEASSTDSEVFKEEIVQVFQIERIKQILRVCLVMDRAQSLYKMQIPNSRFVGMHWYSKFHLASGSSYAKSHDQDKAALEAALLPTASGEKYEGGATMNKRLYKILFTESFGLQEDPHLARWSRPQLASFVEQATASTQVRNEEQQATASTQVRIEEQKQPAKVPSMDCLFLSSSSMSIQDESIRRTVLKFVSAYEEPEYQACLERLHRDKACQDPEEWARKLYLAFRDDPNSTHLKGLNYDRKKCLNLLYDLVNAWQEQKQHHHGYQEFERSIRLIFKVRRVARILSVCLVMDRAQALFKMAMLQPSANNDEGNDLVAVVGMHWFCELHLTNNELSPEFALLLADNYRGTGTMNKRLYWLLHSDLLGLRQNSLFARWSQPQAAEFVNVPLRGHDVPSYFAKQIDAK